MEAYMKVSTMAGTGFGLIMAGVPVFLFVMALCSNKIKNDFKRFYPFYAFISNVVLIISVTFNFRFLNAMDLNLFYTTILFLTCVILDICWFYGIQYAVSLITYRTDETQTSQEKSTLDMLFDNAFFKWRKKVQDKYNKNHGMVRDEKPKIDYKNSADSIIDSTEKTSIDGNSEGLEAHALKGDVTLVDFDVKNIKKSEPKSRKKKSGSQSSGKRKSPKNDYEKTIEYMKQRLPAGKNSCRINVNDLKKSCKMTHHSWINKVRPELMKNGIIKSHPKDTIYIRQQEDIPKQEIENIEDNDQVPTNNKIDEMLKKWQGDKQEIVVKKEDVEEENENQQSEVKKKPISLVDWYRPLNHNESESWYWRIVKLPEIQDLLDKYSISLIEIDNNLGSNRLGVYSTEGTIKINVEAHINLAQLVETIAHEIAHSTVPGGLDHGPEHTELTHILKKRIQGLVNSSGKERKFDV
jgi:hypothetical protein